MDKKINLFFTLLFTIIVVSSAFPSIYLGGEENIEREIFKTLNKISTLPKMMTPFSQLKSLLINNRAAQKFLFIHQCTKLTLSINNFSLLLRSLNFLLDKIGISPPSHFQPMITY